MKKLYTFLTAMLIVLTLLAQAPQKISYQAVIRNANNELVTSTEVGMRISILQGNPDGTVVYYEILTPTTNANGLVSVDFGGGTDFDAIDWSAGTYFLKTEIDPTGGASYSITGVTQLLSVPYALHAKTAESVEEIDPLFTSWDKSTGIEINESQITDLGNYIETETDPIFTQSIDVSGAQIGDMLRFDGDKYSSHSQQQLSLNGNLLSITDGNMVTLPAGTTAAIIPILTTSEIVLLTPENGQTLLNSTEQVLQIYSGSKWLSIHASCWPQPTNAYAGPNQFLTDATTQATLAANTPVEHHGSGQWSIICGIGGSFTDDTDPTTTFTGQLFTLYELQWTISTSCGSSSDNLTIVFGNDGPGDGVTDVDGNTYSTVLIGSQEWMAENLRVTRYNNGALIPNITNYSQWEGMSTGAFAWYDNKEVIYKNAYGAMYNWYAVSTGNLCPTGWRVPSDEDWTALTDYVGGVSVAGGKLKSTRTEPYAHPRWDNPNTGATDEYNFSALPGGDRNYSGWFNGIGNHGLWWSSTEGNETSAWATEMLTPSTYAGSCNHNKKYGLSIRCVRDN